MKPTSRAIAAQQACDEALWFDADYGTEERKLQGFLRALHHEAERGLPFKGMPPFALEWWPRSAPSEYIYAAIKRLYAAMREERKEA